ncbi:unnamed protein product [Rhizophagus irregularis]|nr:unnamed protein product [Rhizophagus irregularis]
MISENKENDRKSHKLDDNGGDVDSGICATEPTILSGRQIMKELAHFFGYSRPVRFALKNIYYCLDSGNWIIYCGSKKYHHHSMRLA